MTSQDQSTSTDRNAVPLGVGMVRLIIGLIIPTLSVAGLVLPVALFGDELPDRVATHFNGSGTADGSMTPWNLVLFAGLVFVLPGVVLMAVAAIKSRRMPRPWPPFAAGLGTFLSALGAAIVLHTVLRQRDLADWREVSGPGLSLVFVIVGPLIVGAVAAVLARVLPYSAESTHFAADPEAEVPTMTIAEGERVVFTETIAPGWMLWLTAGFLAAAVALLVFAGWVVGLITAASALPLLLFSAMRIQADNNGLVVRSALLGWRFARIKTKDIVQASVIDVEPMKWGGWGYRGSLKLAGTAAVVMRRGPGLHLQLTGDRVFVVTMDNPSGAAAVLNATRAGAPSR